MPGENIQDWSITAATNASADSLINWAEGMPRADVNNSARAMMAAVAKHRNLTNGSIVTTGSAAVMGFATPVGYSVIPTGLRITPRMGFANAADVALSVDGTAAVAIKDIAGNNLKAGVLPINSFADLIYNGSNWILLGSTSAGAVSTATSGPWLVAPAATSSIASLALAAGDWQICGLVAVGPGAGPASAYVVLLIGTLPNSTGAALSYNGLYSGPNGEFYGSVIPMTANIATTTTFYLNFNNNGASGFTGTAGTANIYARRMQ